MPSIVMIGGGIAALTTAMLLADDGHKVTVLERDPAARRIRPWPGSIGRGEA